MLTVKSVKFLNLLRAKGFDYVINKSPFFEGESVFNVSILDSENKEVACFRDTIDQIEKAITALCIFTKMQDFGFYFKR